MPEETVKAPTEVQVARVARVASLTAVQLDEAESIVRSRYPSLPHESRVQLVGAVLQAIATNYHAVITRQSGS